MAVMRDTEAPTEQTLVRGYLFLRRAVGILGTALPLVLIIGKALIQGGPLMPSISDYVYTDMRPVLIGTMAAVGVFLLSYQGYGRADDITADVAAVGAIGVALFPTTPSSGPVSSTVWAVGLVHIISAGLFFTATIVFCLVLFTRSDSPQPTGRKKARNWIYITCGVIMVGSLISIGIIEGFLGGGHGVLWLESAAVMAFGIAWLVKGQTFLAD